MTLVVLRTAGERGSALLVAMLTVAFVVPLVLALAFLAMCETALSASYSQSHELTYAADAGAEHARLGVCAADLATLAPPGAGPVVTLDTGITLDLGREGAARQRESDDIFGALPASPDSPQWRLLQHGRLTDMLAIMLPAPVPYVAVWIADDPEDGDENPLHDTNGRLRMISAAYTGRGGVRLVQRAVTCAPVPPQRAAGVMFRGDWP